MWMFKPKSQAIVPPIPFAVVKTLFKLSNGTLFKKN